MQTVSRSETFEYKSEHNSVLANITQLNRLGAEGWELIPSLDNMQNNQVLFRRKIVTTVQTGDLNEFF